MTDPLVQRMVILLSIWAAVILLSIALSPHFLQGSTLSYLLQYVPIIGVLGIAQTVVMLSGGPGIDLSVGAVMSLTGLAIAGLFTAGMPLVLACLAGLLLGAALGAINAVLICVLNVPSLMATLATMFTYGGLALALTGGSPIGGLPDWFAVLAQERVIGIPNHLWLIFAPIAVALHVVLSHTITGAHIYASGNDETAAYLSGVRVAALRFRLYVLSGCLSSVAAIMTLSWFQTARPDAGQGMELLSVTVAVLGGTHIFGGIGRISGTVVAVLIVTTLQAGFQLANISQAWQLGAMGVLLIGSVIADDMVRDRLRGRLAGLA